VKLTTHLPSSAEIKKSWSSTFTHRYVFLASCFYVFLVWYLDKHRKNFTFTVKTVTVSINLDGDVILLLLDRLQQRIPL